MKQRGSQQGFTLVEVLVAFAIVATSLGVLTATLSSSATTMSGLKGRQAAILLAQSKLAEAAPRDATKAVTRSGKSAGGLEWQLAFAPHGSKADRAAWVLDAYTVTATVSYPGRRGSFTLDTLKVSPKR